MLLPLFLLASVLLSRVEGGEIYGGTEVRPHSRPYMASIGYRNEDGKPCRCGGFLVRNNFVMTAAHCNGRNMIIKLGAHNISHKENTWQKRSVLEAIPHPDYDSQSLVNDIMLLKLKKKARITQAVKTIALPSHEDLVWPGLVCSVAGWGKMDGGRPSDTLQEVDMEVQDEQKCENLFGGDYNDAIQLCVGKPKSKEATGDGDSGGPFVCDNVAQGIVSYASINYKELPRVFTRISSFLPWINRTMNLMAKLGHCHLLGVTVPTCGNHCLILIKEHLPGDICVLPLA